MGGVNNLITKEMLKIIATFMVLWAFRNEHQNANRTFKGPTTALKPEIGSNILHLPE